jgi:putative DNA methylase
VGLANALAAKESYNKHLYRPNTYLHKWWARRCGSTFRMILKHLVPDSDKTDYYVAGGLEGKVILDPMMGGATTLHEAIRLGANVIGVDIEPIPVLQARATLTDTPLSELESSFASIYNDLRDELQGHYTTSCPECSGQVQAQFFLHGLVRTCDCGPTTFVDSLVLRYNSDGSMIRLCPNCCNVSKGTCNCGHPSPHPIREKTCKVCPDCGSAFRDTLDIPFYTRYVPVAVVGRCGEHGLFFKRPDGTDLERLKGANEQRSNLVWQSAMEVDSGPKSEDLIRRGISSYLDVFSSRQLLYIKAAERLLAPQPESMRLNLGLLVSTSLEFNSMLCGYKGGDKKRPGAIRHVFSHHAYSFPYTALENNPVYPDRASGTLQGLFQDRIQRGRLWSSRPVERTLTATGAGSVVIDGEVDSGQEVARFEDLSHGTRRFMVLQTSSARLDLPSESVDHVVTDPPYSDSVQYSDLAAFFRVWLEQLLPSAAKWTYDVTQSAVDVQASGNGHYARLLGQIFAECHRVLKKDSGRLVFTFHHWKPLAWAALTVALKRADFILINRYVVHAENPVSVHISNLNALTDDAVLVLGSRHSRGLDPTNWEFPTQISKESSQRFCADCSAAMGWMLQADLGEQEIEQLWTELLP